MSDELVKRLREDQPVTQDMVSTMQCALQDAAADRIEELEAKLANLAHAVWTEHKDWEGERKYALRQIVKWIMGETT
jgi:hypothetical protein